MSAIIITIKFKCKSEDVTNYILSQYYIVIKSQTTWVQIPLLPLLIYVTSGKLCNLPAFTRLQWFWHWGLSSELYHTMQCLERCTPEQTFPHPPRGAQSRKKADSSGFLLLILEKVTLRIGQHSQEVTQQHDQPPGSP